MSKEIMKFMMSTKLDKHKSNSSRIINKIKKILCKNTSLRFLNNLPKIFHSNSQFKTSQDKKSYQYQTNMNNNSQNSNSFSRFQIIKKNSMKIVVTPLPNSN